MPWSVDHFKFEASQLHKLTMLQRMFRGSRERVCVSGMNPHRRACVGSNFLEPNEVIGVTMGNQNSLDVESLSLGEDFFWFRGGINDHAIAGLRIRHNISIVSPIPALEG